MRYTHNINASRCIEWGLNLNQGALVDIINQASSWATVSQIDGITYYWVSRNKVVSEIPLAYSKPDTVYRALKLLAEKGVIEHIKDGKKDLVRLTEKGKNWNVAGTSQGDLKLGNKSESEINPNKLGNKSENNSEINPTYNNTSNSPNTNINNTIVTDSDLLVEFWNSNRPSQAAVKKQVWSKVVKTRLKTFTAEEIKAAMLSIINSQWHQNNNQVLIKNAIDSDKRCAEAIEKSKQPQQSNHQGDNNANHQPVNSQHQQQPNHFDQLRAEAAAKYGRADSEPRTVSDVT